MSSMRRAGSMSGRYGRPVVGTRGTRKAGVVVNRQSQHAVNIHDAPGSSTPVPAFNPEATIVERILESLHLPHDCVQKIGPINVWRLQRATEFGFGFRLGLRSRDGQRTQSDQQQRNHALFLYRKTPAPYSGSYRQCARVQKL